MALFSGSLSAVEQGLIYALLALGVFLTFRILNFADLTVDATFVTGAATAAVFITNGHSPALAVLAGGIAGALGGLITALLHTVGKIDPLLASILTMLGLYSVNLRIMSGRGNISLIRADTMFTPVREHLGTWASVGLMALGVAGVIVILLWFLRTDFGLAIRATGDNPGMASSFGVPNNFTKTVTLMLANGLVGLTGAIVAQYQGFADIGGGTGLILAGLASVILGNAILGTRFMVLALVGVALGSVIYRLAIFLALKLPFVQTTDMKIISAGIVVVALVLSQSTTVRSGLAKLSLWRNKSNLPEPMTMVPNPFSPLASSDAVLTEAEIRSHNEFEPGQSTARTTSSTAVLDPPETGRPQSTDTDRPSAGTAKEEI
ncbi:MAG: ABC transporter permease [Propionibacteriaceae bacterium]|jgi:putative ABC transport system permease protein|nr:ABC transporter permease [Propionibacteriaceae bacterium]